MFLKTCYTFKLLFNLFKFFSPSLFFDPKPDPWGRGNDLNQSNVAVYDGLVCLRQLSV